MYFIKKILEMSNFTIVPIVEYNECNEDLIKALLTKQFYTYIHKQGKSERVFVRNCEFE